MDISAPPSKMPSTAWEWLIDELTRCRESTDMLRVALRQPKQAQNFGIEDDCGTSHFLAQSLIDKILDSFDQSLSILKRSTEANKVSQVLTNKKSKHSTERVCHKKRRNIERGASEIVAPSFEDGHAWRKYGQKKIHGDKYPRSYYRCTHKENQGCKARKQVQNIRDDPPSFKITYYDHHTCKNKQKESQVAILETTENNSSIMWKFKLQGPNDKPKDIAIPVVPVDQQGTKENAEDLRQNISFSPYHDLAEFENFGPLFSDFSPASDYFDNLICSPLSSYAENIINMDVDTTLGPVVDDFFDI